MKNVIKNNFYIKYLVCRVPMFLAFISLGFLWEGKLGVCISLLLLSIVYCIYHTFYSKHLKNRVEF